MRGPAAAPATDSGFRSEVAQRFGINRQSDEHPLRMTLDRRLALQLVTPVVVTEDGHMGYRGRIDRGKRGADTQAAMTRSWCLVVAVGAGLVLMAGGSALGGRSVVKVRTLAVVTGPSPYAFAATTSGAAWIDAVFGCKERIRRLHVLAFGSRPRTLRPRLCSEYAEYGPISFDHGRAVWVQATGGNTSYQGRVLIAGPGDRAATTLKRFQLERGRDIPEGTVTLSGDAVGTVIALDGPVLRIVGRRARLQFGGAGSVAVDVAGNRLGVVRPERQADVSVTTPPSVEVHARKGGLLSKFEIPDRASIAVSAKTVAVWGSDGVINANEPRGRWIASKRVVLPVDDSRDAIGIVGRRIVYPRGRTIHAWDPRTGADKVLATASRQIMNVVVTGHRVIWTERLDSRRFAIKALEVPTSP